MPKPLGMSYEEWNAKRDKEIAELPPAKPQPAFYSTASAIAEIISGNRTAAEIVATELLEPYSVHYYYDADSGRYAEDHEHMDAFEALRDAYDAHREARRTPLVKPELVLCSCGHRVARALVMHASLGTSCPECYDRMSD